MLVHFGVGVELDDFSFALSLRLFLIRLGGMVGCWSEFGRLRAVYFVLIEKV